MKFIALCYVLAVICLLPNLAVSAAIPDASISFIGTAQKFAFLSSHNAVRATHGANPLTWSDALAEMAESWASSCQFKATNGILREKPYGEVIAAATGFFPISSAVDLFVKDSAKYDPSNPTYTHFTQVVWKSTTQIGCAVSRCGDIFDRALGRATLYVCLYDPVGNVIGEAPQNVQV